MANNTTPIGFYDRYDRQDKDWKKILFRPGKLLQAAELNEVQSIIQSENQQIGLALFKEGGILSGCDIVVNDDKTEVAIAKGQVYALGFVHEVEAKLNLLITGVGEEVIGIRITTVIIDQIADGDLLDPAVGAEGYGHEGAHRLKYEYDYVVGDDSAIRVAVLSNGNVDQTYNQLRPMLDSVLSLMAQRTFDESGHYTVNSFDCEIQSLDVDDEEYDTHLNLLIKGGLAYVSGWKVENDAQVIRLERPLTAFDRIDEPEAYQAGQLLYNVDNSPIWTVDNVTATVESSVITVVRGAVGGGLDALPVEFQPIVNIVHVTTGAPYPGGTELTLGADFVQGGNYVDWSPGGVEPNAGSTYYVVVNYVKQLIQAVRTSTEVTEQVTKTLASGGSDSLANSDIHKVVSLMYGTSEYLEGTHFTVNTVSGAIVWLTGSQPNQGVQYTVVSNYWEHTTEGDYVGRSSFVDGNGAVVFDETPTLTPTSLTVDYRKQISFDANGDLPVVSSLFYQDYKYTLPRQDLLVADKRGFLTLLKGIPAHSPGLPVTSPTMMRIAKFSLDPEARASGIAIEYEDNERMTMSNLRTLLGEVKDIQYNQAISELDYDAEKQGLPTEKRGVFSDQFNTLDKTDFSNVECDCTIDVLSESCTLPQTADTHALNSTDPTINNSFLLPYSHVPLIIQPYATSTIQVNPYTKVSMEAELDIEPNFDRWTETSTTTVRGPDRVVQIPPRTIRNKLFLWQHGPRGNWNLRVGSAWAVRGGAARIVPRAEWLRRRRAGSRVTEVGSRSEVISNSINRVVQNVQIDEIALARQITITLAGKRLIPDETDIVCHFDGAKTPITPTGSSSAGTKPGSVLANSNGEFTGTIQVPPGTKSGSHELTVSGTTQTGGAGSRASDTFYSAGLHRKITEQVTFTKVRRNVRTLQTVQAVDPIAQTFGVASDCFISKIDIFLKSKPTSGNDNLEILIVPVDTGIPTQTVLGKSELTPSEVNVSDDATAATTFIFNTPVFCEPDKEYAFIVRTNSSNYIAHISRVGQLDATNGWVTTNPNTGVLLTSANMATWSAEQNADIKFSMYRANFDQTERILPFDSPTLAEAVNRFEMVGTFAEPNADTMVRYQYSKDNNLWFDFTPPVEVDVGIATSELHFRAIMTGTALVTPVVHDSTYMNVYRWQQSGSYIARQFVLHEEDCRYVNVWLDSVLPSNTTVVPQVNFNDGNGWQDITHMPADDRPIDQEWTERHYTYDTGSDAILKQAIQIRVNMTSSSNYSSPQIARLRVVASTI